MHRTAPKIENEESSELKLTAQIGAPFVKDR
jgi:hypothetical protein